MFENLLSSGCDHDEKLVVIVIALRPDEQENAGLMNSSTPT
jgi:hypothetical protein